MTRESPTAYLDALERVFRALTVSGFEAMVVGGFATLAWGTPRTTEDMDLAVRLRGKDADAVRTCLRPLGVEPQGPFMTDFGRRLILPFKEGIPLDVFLAEEDKAAEFGRKRKVTVAGVTLWFIAPEDFVVGKLRGAMRWPEERAKDLADAGSVLFAQWRSFDFDLARTLAEAHGLTARLDELATEVREARRRAGLDA